MTYKKPQTPIMNGTDGIYPLTTADQIIKADGSRLEQDGKIIADNATIANSANNASMLANKAPEAYVLHEDALSLEEIQASSDLMNKVAGAEAVKSIKSEVGTLKQGNFYTEQNKGNTMPATYGGFVRIRGRSWPGSFDGDTYYLGADADSNAYSGAQVNGATQITWKAL